MNLVQALTPTIQLLLIRALINVAVAVSVVVAGSGLKRSARNKTTGALYVMFLCIAIEIVIVTVALFLSENVRHVLAILARLIEGFGVAYFLHYLTKNGRASKQTGE